MTDKTAQALAREILQKIIPQGGVSHYYENKYAEIITTAIEARDAETRQSSWQTIDSAPEDGSYVLLAVTMTEPQAELAMDGETKPISSKGDGWRCICAHDKPYVPLCQECALDVDKDCIKSAITLLGNGHHGVMINALRALYRLRTNATQQAATIAAQQVEIARLREALQFYADFNGVIMDGGSLAREALKPNDGEV